MEDVAARGRYALSRSLEHFCDSKNWSPSRISLIELRRKLIMPISMRVHESRLRSDIGIFEAIPKDTGVSRNSNCVLA